MTMNKSMQYKMTEVIKSSSKLQGVHMLPTSLKFANNLEEAVRIKVEPDDLDPVTIPDMFLAAMKQWDSKTALASRNEIDWSWMSYKVYYMEVLHLAKVFIELGLNLDHGVAIACSNSQSYFIAALAAIFAGGFFVGLPCMDNQNQKTISQHILKECMVNIIIVDKFASINMAQEVGMGITTIKAIVDLSVAEKKEATLMNLTLNKLSMVNKAANKIPVFNGGDMFFLAKSIEDSTLRDRLDKIAPNKCCAVFYPHIVNSFMPIGVMYSHDNLTYMAKRLGEKLAEEYSYLKSVPSTNFRIVSYLPLNIPFSLVLEMLVPWTQGGLTAFPSSQAQGILIPTLREVQPHIFCASHSMWGHLQRWISEKSNLLPRIRRQVLAWSRRKNLLSFYQNVIKYNNLELRQPGRVGKYVSRKVKRFLGFNRCGIYMSFGEDLRIETLEYFVSLNMPILETLSSPLLAGPHCIGSLSNYLIGSVGFELKNFRSKLTDSKGQKGKILCRGRHVCMGIIHPVSLNILFDKEGYIYTGVKAFRGSNDFLYVRLDSKDVLVMSCGTKVAFARIEKMFKDILPIINYCVVVGHHRSYLSILVTLKTEIDPVTLRPTNVLVRSVQRWLQRREVDITNIEDIVRGKASIVSKTIEDAIMSVNKSMTNAPSKIKFWRILPRDFSLVDGDVDPITMELRREVILKKYRNVIDTIYRY